MDGLGCPCAARATGDVTSEPLTTNAGTVRRDVIVPAVIIAGITALAIWVSFKK